MCGLAFDYCVGNTAKDAQILSNGDGPLKGLKVNVLMSATRSIAADTEAKMRQELETLGANFV